MNKEATLPPAIESGLFNTSFIEKVFCFFGNGEVLKKAVTYECMACRCPNTISVEPAYIDGEAVCKYCKTVNLINLKRAND